MGPRKAVQNVLRTYSERRPRAHERVRGCSAGLSGSRGASACDWSAPDMRGSPPACLFRRAESIFGMPSGPTKRLAGWLPKQARDNVPRLTTGALQLMTAYLGIELAFDASRREVAPLIRSKTSVMR